MATEQAAQWTEPSARDSMASVAENRLQATATAIEQDAGVSARRVTSRALSWRARAARSTSALTRSTLRGVHALARSSRERGERARRTLTPALPWIGAGGASWFVYASTQSWTQAAIAGTCLFALTSLSAMRHTQRLEARALQEQLMELRLSLRVTQALLDVERIEDAEHLDDELESTRESGTRRLPRQRASRPQLG